jgi:hypothetical protein
VLTADAGETDPFTFALPVDLWQLAAGVRAPAAWIGRQLWPLRDAYCTRPGVTKPLRTNTEVCTRSASSLVLTPAGLDEHGGRGGDGVLGQIDGAGLGGVFLAGTGAGYGDGVVGAQFAEPREGGC